MPLFGRAPAADPASPDTLNDADAVVGIAVAAMYADGVLGAEEHEALLTHVSQLAVCADLGEQDLRAMFGRIETLAAEAGDEGLLQRCAEALPPRLHATAYLVAADIVLGDGEVGADERAFLDRVQKALQLDEGEAQKIRHVVTLRHVR